MRTTDDRSFDDAVAAIHRRKFLAFAAWKLLLLLVLIATAFMLNACTIVKYTDGDKSLLVADIRITGSAIDLSGTITGVGTLDVNREQGSAEGIAKIAADAATGGMLGPLSE